MGINSPSHCASVISKFARRSTRLLTRLYFPAEGLSKRIAHGSHAQTMLRVARFTR